MQINPSRLSRYQAKLQCIKENDQATYQWIFLPGGPGLGSEYFSDFMQELKLPGSLWRIDLPGNGSHRPLMETDLSLSLWRHALKDALSLFSAPILVAHSFGGMLFQSIEISDDLLKGVVLLSSSPKPFTESVEAAKKKRQLPDRTEALQRLMKNPSDEAFKEYCLQVLCYWFNEEHLETGKEFISSIPVHYLPFTWAPQFYRTFRRRWQPTPKVPTLIATGEEDLLTPLWLFDEPDFNQPWIQKVRIPKGGHFPWIESMEASCHVLESFGHSLPLNKNSLT